ncbi:calcium/calmodulin-dependent protein kinase type 1B, partial [Cercophora scortea]
VIQTEFISNPATGQRRAPCERRWEPTEELGRGSYGVVTLEKCTSGPASGQVRAVKRLEKGAGHHASLSYRRELEAIAKFSQEKYRDCFVQSFGWYETDSAIYITMEYLPLGDLAGYMHRPIPEVQTRDITKQLLEGLQFMHDSHFAHRDLKPANILVLHHGPNWWVKIADFGISKRAESTPLRTVVGTMAYMTPEVRGIFTLDSQPEDEKTFSLAVDIWSAGAIVFQMLFGKPVFLEGRPLFDYVVRGAPFVLPDEESISPECASFIRQTMAACPGQRPTPERALAHSWILLNLPTPAEGTDLNPMFDTSLNSNVKKLDVIPISLSVPSASWSTTMPADDRDTAAPLRVGTFPSMSSISRRSTSSSNELSGSEGNVAVQDIQPCPTTINTSLTEIGRLISVARTGRSQFPPQTRLQYSHVKRRTGSRSGRPKPMGACVWRERSGWLGVVSPLWPSVRS